MDQKTSKFQQSVDETLEELQRAYNQLPKTSQSVCPNCGYCPHCGRGGHYTYPWYPSPWITWTTGPTLYKEVSAPTITSGGVSQPSTSGTWVL